MAPAGLTVVLHLGKEKVLLRFREGVSVILLTAIAMYQMDIQCVSDLPGFQGVVGRDVQPVIAIVGVGRKAEHVLCGKGDIQIELQTILFLHDVFAERDVISTEQPATGENSRHLLQSGLLLLLSDL